MINHYDNPLWNAKSESIKKRDNYTCRNCGKKYFFGMNVHHLYYLPGREVWNYSDELLVTLCQNCHDRIHELKFEVETKVKKMFLTTNQLEKIDKIICEFEKIC